MCPAAPSLRDLKQVNTPEVSVIVLMSPSHVGITNMLPVSFMLPILEVKLALQEDAPCLSYDSDLPRPS